MFSPSDTIVAIATPAGRGGIGVVRISGPQAQEVAATVAGRSARFEARHATLTDIRADGIALDRAVVTFFPSRIRTPAKTSSKSADMGARSFCAPLLRGDAAGARLAEPGEFTFRAYLHGRMDLVQAEAVRDLVDAVTPLQARAAFDQLEGTLTTRIREIDTRFSNCPRGSRRLSTFQKRDITSSRPVRRRRRSWQSASRSSCCSQMRAGGVSCEKAHRW
jgi:tRNA modification GTPase